MKGKHDFFSIILAFLAVILTFLMVLYPEATFKGANYGFRTWVTILIPALLPFFIIADILVELGVVNFLGVLLEPLMRPVFKQPGAAGFVLAMGFTSGFPMGAVLTNKLYEKNLCTKEEAGRLIAFTNNSSPLFLLVAVPVGMFGNPHLGILFALTHYGANILLGILLGYNRQKLITGNLTKSPILKRSLQELILARQKNRLTIGKILGNAINKAIQTILMIGGFVIFFAVLIEIFRVTNIFLILNLLSSKILYFLGINPNLGEALTTGFWEMTLGAKQATEANASLFHQVIITSFILGWSGLSIQAQVSSIAAENKIPIGRYLVGRFFQGVIAAFLTAFLFSHFINSLPVLNLNLELNTYFLTKNYFLFNILSICILMFILLVMATVFHFWSLKKL